VVNYAAPASLKFMPQAIALLDCNNFYASCERVFDARLRKRPIVVLSNNDGCVISRSDEAKEAGVPMGAKLFKVAGLIDENNGEILSSNYELYGDMSGRVMENLAEFTPEIEVYSIDEAFLGLDESKQSFTKIGREIQEAIQKRTGLPVSIGIAETKTLAKLANRIARDSKKADGVLDLFRSPYTDLALKRTAVGKVWGIGPNYVRTLDSNNIKTAFDLRQMDLRRARKLLSVVGARVVMELRGIQTLPLDLNPPPRRSITCSRSFGQNVLESKVLREAVAVFLAQAAEKLRRHRLAAQAVTVFISTNRFNQLSDYYSNSATYNSAYPTDINHELQTWTFNCLDKIFQQGFAYHKAGIILSGLVPAERLTTRMFDETRWQRFRSVMTAVDEINRKFGRNTVRFAVANPNGAWQGKCAYRSPRYTTRLNEVMQVL
jgi:DNA polymerase V